jgi:hypothetical protein
VSSLRSSPRRFERASPSYCREPSPIKSPHAPHARPPTPPPSSSSFCLSPRPTLVCLWFSRRLPNCADSTSRLQPLPPAFPPPAPPRCLAIICALWGQQATALSHIPHCASLSGPITIPAFWWGPALSLAGRLFTLPAATAATLVRLHFGESEEALLDTTEPFFAPKRGLFWSVLSSGQRRSDPDPGHSCSSKQLPKGLFRRQLALGAPLLRDGRAAAIPAGASGDGTTQGVKLWVFVRSVAAILPGGEHIVDRPQTLASDPAAQLSDPILLCNYITRAVSWPIYIQILGPAG